MHSFRPRLPLSSAAISLCPAAKPLAGRLLVSHSNETATPLATPQPKPLAGRLVAQLEEPTTPQPNPLAGRLLMVLKPPKLSWHFVLRQPHTL